MSDAAIIAGLDAEEYHARPEVSNSQLLDLARSPWHFWRMHRDPHRPPPKQRAGQLEGTLAHTAILEPDAFDARYVVGPAQHRNTKAWKEFVEDNAGRIAIQPDQYDTAMRQAEAVHALDDVGLLLVGAQRELSAFWTDEATGVPCRCRPDAAVQAYGGTLLFDVKTYSDADPFEFARQVARKAYYQQDAFYSTGFAAAIGHDVLAFTFIAVETTYPFAASAHVLEPGARAVGMARVRRLLDQYAACARDDRWPGFGGEVHTITLPDWAN